MCDLIEVPPLKMFTDDFYTVIAETKEEAVCLALGVKELAEEDWYGEEWEEKDPDSEFTLNNENDEDVTMTVRQWIAFQGKGVLAVNDC